MTYQEALDFIWSLVNFETTPPENRAPYDLSRMARFLERLGQPQERFPALHVAGTKGKGSTSAMMERVLREAGYRTGFYCSPHLHSPRERVRIGGIPISQDRFVALVEKVRPHVDTLGDVTTFEALTGIAFLAFAEAEVEVAVVEVGLGGRLDATNFVRPLVSVITPLGLEHTAVLGDTIEQIAAEKGGIIKPGAPTVSAAQPPAAMDVLRRITHERGSALTVAPEVWEATLRSTSLDGQRFDLMARDGSHRYEELTLPLLGVHQVSNAIVAVAALHEVRGRGLLWEEVALRRGLAAVEWPARVEVIRRNPLVVVDGAHTQASAAALLAALRSAMPNGWGRATLVLGISRDKDVEVLLDALAPLAERLILTQARHPRAADPEKLAQHPALTTRQPLVVPNVAKAVAEALDQAAEDDLIVVAGSLFVAAEARYALLTDRESDLEERD